MCALEHRLGAVPAAKGKKERKSIYSGKLSKHFAGMEVASNCKFGNLMISKML